MGLISGMNRIDTYKVCICKIPNCFLNVKWDLFVLPIVMEKAAESSVKYGQTFRFSFWGSSSQFRMQQNRAKEQ